MSLVFIKSKKISIKSLCKIIFVLFYVFYMFVHKLYNYTINTCGMESKPFLNLYEIECLSK